jgi:hypothetical protein
MKSPKENFFLVSSESIARRLSGTSKKDRLGQASGQIFLSILFLKKEVRVYEIFHLLIFFGKKSKIGFQI